MQKRIQFTDITLRDGHQSIAATRMSTQQAMRVLPLLRDSGFNVLELWGGATLDSAIRFLNENPWQRLEQFSEALQGKAQIQALLRGQNLFGYQPYADDLVVAFVRQAVRSGVGVMRIFDALNDIRNLETAVLATKAYGAKAEAALSYTVSPVHTTEYFIDYALKLEELGADQIAIKDMAGILHPKAAVELINGLKSRLKIPLALHSHTTTGVALLNAVIGLKAGIDSIDTAVTPFAGGSSHPPVEILMAFAEEMGVEHGLDKTALIKAQQALFGVYEELKDHISYYGKYYRPVRFEDVNRAQVNQVLRLLDQPDEQNLNQAIAITRQMMTDLGYPAYDDRIFESQIPGGMLSNLQSQLKLMGRPDIMDQVMLEIPRVRADVGYVPLVTPTSQIVGSQAAFNVISGQRYAFVSNEFKMILRGEFGRTPAEPNPEIVNQVLGVDESPLRYRPSSYLNPVLEETYDLPFVHNQKDLLLHLLFGASADEFLRNRPAEHPEAALN